MMKQLLLLIAICFISITLTSQAIAQPTDSDADGRINISTFSDLLWVSNNPTSWGQSFELDNNIDASASLTMNIGNHDGDPLTPDVAMGWQPIGRDLNADGDCDDLYERFSGTFDGQGYDIDGIYINRPQVSYIGFFGSVESASGSNIIIENLGLTDIQITGKERVGGLSGYFLSSTASITINKCFVEGTVNGGNRIGGLVGYQYTGSGSITISESYTSVAVSGNNRIGGIIGYALSNTGIMQITNTYANGAVTGANQVGGFSGYVYGGNIRINNCYCMGIVSGTGLSVAGFIGEDYQKNTTYTACFWNTETANQTNSVGNVTPTPAGLTPITDAAIKNIATYTTSPANWDFTNTWAIFDDIYNGYPFLKNIQDYDLIDKFTIEVKVLMAGLWSGIRHKPAPIIVQVYESAISGSTDWTDYSLLNRYTGIIDEDGWFVYNVNLGSDAISTTHSYQIIVWAAAYLPLITSTPISIANAKISYDFSTAYSKALGGEKALYKSGAFYLMRAGDLNQDLLIDANDTQIIAPSFGTNLYPYLPNID